MKQSLSRVALLTLILGMLEHVHVAADTLQDILDRGQITVGVKADYAPWGMRDKNGAIVGMEIDLVKDFVRRLEQKTAKSIELQLVTVVASNRMQMLAQGKTDLLIATMSDIPERREVVGIVQPNYYSSGVAVLARKSSGISGWDSLVGKKLCGIQGSWYNEEHGAKNGAKMVEFRNVAEAETAVLDNRCTGWLYDASVFVTRTVNDLESWQDFTIATPVVDSVPWGAAVRLADLGGPFAQLLSDTIIDWHKSGYLIALEAKWNIPRNQWLVYMFKQCNAEGPICDGLRDN